MKPDASGVAYRRFRQSDLPEIERIQDLNLISNLSSPEQADGFLSVAFSPEQLVRMDSEIPIVVADLDGRLGGYLASTSLEEGRGVPILARMLSEFETVRFAGAPLARYRSFIYGPVCVDRTLRGRGLLEGLFAECLRGLAGRFEAGVLFISEDNPRSLAAHQRLGIKRVGRFVFDGRPYHLLAFAVPPAAPG